MSIKNSISIYLEDTVELLSVDEIWHIKLNADFSIIDIVERFFEAAKNLIRMVKTVDCIYTIKPILITSNVDPNILVKLPSNVDNFHIKWTVRDSQLYINNLARGTAHAGGVGQLIGQFQAWNNSNHTHFVTRTDGITEFGHGSAAPDVVMSVRSPFRIPGGQGRHSTVIVKLEVENRSGAQMRRDFRRYFDDDCLVSMVGIKCFTHEDCKVCHAIAVQWTRTAARVITLTTVRDFGIIPLEAQAIRSFVEEMEDALPPVPENLWHTNHHVPLPAVLVASNTPIAQATQWINSQLSVNALYVDSTVPTLTLHGADLAVVLHNIQQGNNLLTDLTLDLGRVLFDVIAD